MTTFEEKKKCSFDTFRKALHDRINEKIRSNRSPVVLSLMAIGLSGCGGSGNSGGSGDGNSFSTFSSSGTAIKGLLSNATVFIDLNGDGTLDSDELSTTTNADGSFSFSTTDQSRLQGDFIVKTNANTIDSSSGEILSDVTLKAVEGSAVISPATTLIKTQP